MAKLKAFRLTDALREELEAFCKEHLLDERAVVEASILHYLHAKPAERQGLAKRYNQWKAALNA